QLVVVLLLAARNPDLVLDRLFLAPARTSRRGLGGGVAALFGPADLFLGVETFEDEVDGRRDERRRRAWRQAGPFGQLAETPNAARLLDELTGRCRVAGRQRPAEVEPLDDRARVDAVEHAGEDRAARGADQIARHLLGAAQLALVLELELAGDRWQRRVDVGDARH